MVAAMSERDGDPIANTQMFRAFVQRDDARHSGHRRSRLRWLAVTLAVAAIVIVVVVAWLVAG
jgi:Flp pilus assembly protein TadB